MDAIEGIIQEMQSVPQLTRDEIRRIKMRMAKKYKLGRIPVNSEILMHAKDQKLIALLRKKPIRSLSGVAVVAVMTRPYRCPGKCIYCPRGEDAPQSYTGKEPAALRAKRANYDPYIQVSDRLAQLKAIGHPVDKVELIVMGGTFLAQPADYQAWFLKRCFEAMNGSVEVATLGEAQKLNENAKVRNVGLTFETRPDYAKGQHVDVMLDFGVTRVELGVQTLYDSIYEKVNRGHSVQDVVEATRILKDSGLKVCYHMMPGLFSNFEQDLEIFKMIFEDQRFKPDALKIYPTLVIKGTELYRLWKNGEYKPYSDEEALELLCKIKMQMPKWMRTMRIQRDIPAHLIEAGVKRGNLGELVYKKLKGRCKCIRCRDVGHLIYKEGIELREECIEILDEEYEASEGVEHFISVEERFNNALIAYLRLRFPSEKAHRKEVDNKTALVRELKVLGQAVPIGARIPEVEAKQHKGWGALLLKKAEEICSNNAVKKLLVTTAVGARNYYRKFGYRKIGPYIGKKIF